MPGTRLARAMSPARQWAWRNVRPALRLLPGVTSPQGSARHLAALALDEVEGGRYVELGRTGRTGRSSPVSHDRQRAERLWEVAEALTGLSGAAASDR